MPQFRQLFEVARPHSGQKLSCTAIVLPQFGQLVDCGIFTHAPFALLEGDVEGTEAATVTWPALGGPMVLR
jgi:hypothetical protein